MYNVQCRVCRLHETTYLKQYFPTFPWFTCLKTLAFLVLLFLLLILVLPLPLLLPSSPPPTPPLPLSYNVKQTYTVYRVCKLLYVILHC